LTTTIPALGRPGTSRCRARHTGFVRYRYSRLPVRTLDGMTGSVVSAHVTAVDHVGLAVPDLDAAIEFHRRTFGFELTHVEDNEEQGVREAMLRAPGDSGAAVQLLAPLRADSAIGKFLDRRGPGIQQVAFRVEDVEKTAAILREQGLRLLYDTAKRGTADSRVNFVHPKDAGGVLVELVQPAAED
jgi:methylmalonyl-CoA/ethylmalonyl-CoA epimerase